MAGSNQSQQLQGMLGRLSGAFSMDNMGGAGTAYAQLYNELCTKVPVEGEK